MIISVASGKGGTGKTTVAVNLAVSLGNAALMDCDVEEPNAHIFLKPVIETKLSACIPVPKIDEHKCTFCGKCREICEYNALAVIKPKDGLKGSVLVFPVLCHGCGACSALCPEKAIEEINRETGTIEKGIARGMDFYQGCLNIGETMAPPVIRQLKKLYDYKKTLIIDAPPGTSCPVIASAYGSDFCILVTEPTPFGLNDLRLAVDVLVKLNIPLGVVINRCDIGDNKTREYCEVEGIDILMEIPFDREIASLYSSGEILVDHKSGYRGKFIDLFDKIKRKIEKA